MRGGEAGPSLVNEAFRKKWEGVPAEVLQLFVKGSMPPANPGGRSNQYDAAAVASDVYHRMGTRGQINEDNFRIIQETSRNESLTTGTVDGAIHLVNSVLVEVENKIATMIRPTWHMRGQTKP